MRNSSTTLRDMRSLRTFVLAFFAVALGVATQTCPTVAKSQTQTPNSTPEPKPPVEQKLEWPERYRRNHILEGVMGPALVTTALSLYLGPDAPVADFSYGNDWDRDVQSTLSIRSSGYQDAARVASDFGFYGAFLYRTFDATVMVGTRRHAWDVAWRLAAMDAMAFGLVGTVVWSSQLVYGRERPAAYYCRTDPMYQDVRPGCNPDSAASARSMISGHIGVAVAGAALTCVHHAHLPIYSRKGSLAACGAHVGFATLATIGRSTGDHHWPTDVLMGVGLGAVAGWLLPRLLHYGFDTFSVAGETAPTATSSTRAASKPPTFQMAVAPWFGEVRGGARIQGAFL